MNSITTAINVIGPLGSLLVLFSIFLLLPGTTTDRQTDSFVSKMSQTNSTSVQDYSRNRTLSNQRMSKKKKKEKSAESCLCSDSVEIFVWRCEQSWNINLNLTVGSPDSCLMELNDGRAACHHHTFLFLAPWRMRRPRSDPDRFTRYFYDVKALRALKARKLSQKHEAPDTCRHVSDLQHFIHSSCLDGDGSNFYTHL